MDVGRKREPVISKYIYDYPENKIHEFNHLYDKNIDNLTIGDLHGNPIKLIHILIDHGIIDFPSPLTLEEKKEQYQLMVDSYDQNLGDYKEDEDTYDIKSYSHKSLERFFPIMLTFQFNDHSPLIRLLGDILADRGKNDLFTLGVLSIMSDNNILFEINVSNHDEEYIRVYIRSIRNSLSENQFGPYITMTRPALSLNGLGIYLSETNKIFPDKAREFLDDIIDMTDNIYLPNLKFINYEYDEKTNTVGIFTHAPVGLITIELLAMDLGIQYDDSNVKNIITTIELINEKLSDLVKSGMLNEKVNNGRLLYEAPQPSFPNGRKSDYMKLSMQEIKDTITNISNTPKHKITPEQKQFLNDHIRMVIYRLMWERVANKVNNTYDETDMPKTKNGINFIYGHGHDTPKKDTPQPTHITNYDSIKGKMPSVAHEKYYHEMTFSTLSSQIENPNNIYTIEDYIDHAESKGFNSLMWPLMNEIRKSLIEMNQMVTDQNPNVFFQSSTKFPASYLDSLKENIKKLPKIIANEYTKELEDIMRRTEKIENNPSKPQDATTIVSTETQHNLSKK